MYNYREEYKNTISVIVNHWLEPHVLRGVTYLEVADHVDGRRAGEVVDCRHHVSAAIYTTTRPAKMAKAGWPLPGTLRSDSNYRSC